MSYIPKYSRERREKRNKKYKESTLICVEKDNKDLVFGKWLVFRDGKELREK